MTTVLSYDATMSGKDENSTIRVAELITNLAETESLEVVETPKCMLIIIEQVQTSSRHKGYSLLNAL